MSQQLGSRILVVEDFAEAANSLAKLLTMFGYEVEIARDGMQAIESAVRARPDFVLLDIGLPGMDGFEVATRLREELSGRKTVIIATTGYHQSEFRERSRSVGIDFYMVKPLDPDALLRLLSV
jgi:DNA-binding response OmpR family regulator